MAVVLVVHSLWAFFSSVCGDEGLCWCSCGGGSERGEDANNAERQRRGSDDVQGRAEQGRDRASPGLRHLHPASFEFRELLGGALGFGLPIFA